MRWIGRLAVPSTLVILLAVPVAGQTYFFVGGGATIPSGEFGDFAKTGWVADAGVTADVGGKGVWVGGELLYGSNKHEGTSGNKTNIYGATGLLGYTFQNNGSVHPYIYGGAGFLAHQFKPGGSGSPGLTSDTETKFNWVGAGGLAFTLSPRVSLWTEGRYDGASGTQHISLLAGFNFEIGRRK